MKKLRTAPEKMKALLIFCLVGAVVSMGITYFVYLASRNTVQAVGRDTVPTIIAAQNIKATLASAHSNAMNAMVTREKLGGKFWGLYRNDMNSLHSQLVEASRNITYGDAERIPLERIASNISAYEYTVGGAAADGAEVSVDQFMEANRLMQQKILPSSSALNRVNISQLDSVFDGYSKNINIIIVLMVLTGLGFLAVLVFTQYHLFKSSRRILNLGLLAASLLFFINLIYSTSVLTSVKADLYTARNDAFASINSLWNARAVAYNAKSLQSLYLLHEGTGIVQTADTINFNLSAESLYKGQNPEGISEGHLGEALDVAALKGEDKVVDNTINQWAKYVEVDKKVRNLEYDSKHSEAVALSIGDAPGHANYEFIKFDNSLVDIIKTNQDNFEFRINSAFKSLRFFPYATVAFLMALAAACILGMKARMDEYRA